MKCDLSWWLLAPWLVTIYVVQAWLQVVLTRKTARWGFHVAGVAAAVVFLLGLYAMYACHRQCSGVLCHVVVK